MPYVKRTTSTRRYPYYRRPAAKKRTRVYKRKPRGAPVKRKLATATKMLEQKYCPINRISEQAPAAIQAGAQVYALHALLGASVPPNWNGSFTPIGGLAITQGDGVNSRDGNMVYLQNTRMSFIIDMKSALHGPASQIKYPLMFRMVVFKSKLKYLAGGTSDPGYSLFLNEVDAAVGAQNSGITGMDLMTFKPNRRNFTVLKDTRFTLSPPMVNAVNAAPAASGIPGTSNTLYYSLASGPYPTSKEIEITLPHNKKVHYDTSNNPDNYNGAWCVAFFARSQGQDDNANLWELNMRAATKFKDI